ncbi:MAG TPA: PIN domain-containing protein [Candidatus Rubrimentiphilum sp.]|nr:PIN domain-containing protein [Candidatus Rubrimentiphilum sp.]
MIFVDTSALYALLDADEARHVQAASKWTDVVEQRPSLLTTNYVVLETTSIVQSRLGFQATRRLYNDLLPPIAVHFVDAALHDAAVDLLLAENQRRVSLVDCVSFLFMRRNSMKRAFAFDRDFERFGFELC